MFIDGHNITALVNTRAYYSVISGLFAAKLKKVRTAWEGLQIQTAGGHVITPTGTCMARATVRDWTYLARFVILKECSRDVILGMDFLS